MKIYTITDSKDSFYCDTLTVSAIKGFVDNNMNDYGFDEFEDKTLFSYLKYF
jgi:hypothetical protein